MSKLWSFAICTISVVMTIASIAWAQGYTTIDFPGATATTLNGGPNPKGTSVGSYTASGVTHGFTVTKKGKFTSFDPPGSTGTFPNWMSPRGVIVGQYFDASGASHGFVLANGTYTTVNFPGAPGSGLTSVNASGQMSGFSCDAAACNTTTHSFVMSKKGKFTGFDPPGAISSLAVTVIASGVVFGSYTDSSGVGHGYELNHGTYTTIDFPGASFTFVGGANSNGESVGEEVTAGVAHSFLLANGAFTSFDPPGAVLSDASGINPSGVIVGLFIDSGGVEHGYIRTP